MMSEEDGARLLGPLRTMDVPASDRVSVPRAIRTGKRTKALRVAAAGVLVLIIASAFPLLIHPHAGPPPVANSTFEPLVRTISVGSVAGFHPDVYLTGRGRQSIELAPDRKGDQSAHVLVSAPHTIGAPSGEPMPDINGKRALWTGTDVAVEWAPDAWAFVEVQGYPDDRDRARLLAESLKFDEHVQIEVPYTVETSWELDGARVTGDDVELVFANGVRLALRGGVGLAQGPASPAELDALGKSLRRADPPVTNPLR